MTINFEKVRALRTHGQAYSYRDRETMLYALGVGMGGAAPFDERELAFVYENGLKAMPTLATVAAWGAGDFASTGVNYLKVVHGEQRRARDRWAHGTERRRQRLRLHDGWRLGVGDRDRDRDPPPAAQAGRAMTCRRTRAGRFACGSIDGRAGFGRSSSRID